MLYAQVVVGLAVEGPFDYIVPLALEKRINVGSRVWVHFGRKRRVGYVVGLSRRTNITKLKEIVGAIDEIPIFSKRMLSLSKEVADYYCCFLGEVIETALPESLRRGKALALQKYAPGKTIKRKVKSYFKALLVHAVGERARWKIYSEHIREALQNHSSVVILLPDTRTLGQAVSVIREHLQIEPVILLRGKADEVAQWLKLKEKGARVVLGLRSAIFAPVENLGLIIIDEEEDAAYKQDQTPHYHAREVAFMRARRESTKLILGSSAPTLESFYKARKNKIAYQYVPLTREFPKIDLIKPLFLMSARESEPFSKFLQDAIQETLQAKGRVLLFLNRRGFATYIRCRKCGFILQCPRCACNLTFHFKENILRCHFCNYTLTPATICSNCNADYIRYSGTGTEKIESEVSRVFPLARIQRLDKTPAENVGDADIFVATSYIMKGGREDFDLVGVLSIDNALQRLDLRSAEKTFRLLVGLLNLTKTKLVIQTRFSNHYCFRALLQKDLNIFYDEELKHRRQLRFPPYSHIAMVILRGRKELKVKQMSQALFEELKKSNTDSSIEVRSLHPSLPSRLRGNFYWRIMLMAKNVKKMSSFLKSRLKKLSFSGIIVTVDVDPL